MTKETKILTTMENNDTFLKIVELVLTQNASTKTILDELKLLRELRQSQKMTASQIKMEAARLHLDTVIKECKRKRASR